METPRRFASKVWRGLRRGIALVGTAETILGLPDWVGPLKRRLSVGAAAMIAVMSGLPWYLAIPVYVGLFLGLLLAGGAAVWAFKASRYYAVRRMAALLREAAERARELDKVNPWKEVSDPAIGIVQIEDFVMRAFAYHVVADFENYKRIMERKYGYKYFDRVAEYLEELADRLTWKDIDPRFRAPEKFTDFDPWDKKHNQ